MLCLGTYRVWVDHDGKGQLWVSRHPKESVLSTAGRLQLVWGERALRLVEGVPSPNEGIDVQGYNDRGL